MTIIDEILALYRERAQGAYFGEAVSELEHGLQAAALAVAAAAPEPLVLAALLHDIGHLLHRFPENIADLGVDAGHERIGAAWLARHFDAAVTEPIRLHVDAKRYLCAIDPRYASGLSPASTQSLGLQGGAMTPQEADAFSRRPWAGEAVRLRRWDDGAKISGLEVAGLEAYRPLLERAAARA